MNSELRAKNEEHFAVSDEVTESPRHQVTKSPSHQVNESMSQ